MESDGDIDFNAELLKKLKWYEEEATEEEKKEIDEKVLESMRKVLGEIKERNRRQELAWYEREHRRYTI